MFELSIVKSLLEDFRTVSVSGLIKGTQSYEELAPW